VDRGDAPDRKHTAQTLAERIGSEILESADDHGARMMHPCRASARSRFKRPGGRLDA
jgi:ferredoxin